MRWKWFRENRREKRKRKRKTKREKEWRKLILVLIWRIKIISVICTNKIELKFVPYCETRRSRN